MIYFINKDTAEVFAYKNKAEYLQLVKDGHAKPGLTKLSAAPKAFEVWNGSKFVFDVASAKRAKQKEIDTGSKQALSSLLEKYSREEIDSWSTQELEANAWTADNTAATPLLDAMSANRPGMTKKKLVSKVLTNASNYKQFSGVVFGKKHGFEDSINRLDASAGQIDFDAIVVKF